jgi:hypothetical protein
MTLYHAAPFLQLVVFGFVEDAERAAQLIGQRCLAEQPGLFKAIIVGHFAQARQAAPLFRALASGVGAQGNSPVCVSIRRRRLSDLSRQLPGSIIPRARKRPPFLETGPFLRGERISSTSQNTPIFRSKSLFHIS